MFGFMKLLKVKTDKTISFYLFLCFLKYPIKVFSLSHISYINIQLSEHGFYHGRNSEGIHIRE